MSDWEPVSENTSEAVVVQRRSKVFLLFLLSLLLSTATVWLVMTPDALLADSTSSSTRRGRQGDALQDLMGDNFIYLFWGLAALFIAMTLYYLASIFKPARLVLADKGLTIANFHNEKNYAWKDVSPFMLMERTSGLMKIRSIEFFENVEGKAKKRGLPRGLDMKKVALAQMLNDYRERALNLEELEGGVEITPTEAEVTKTGSDAVPVASLQDNHASNNSGDWQPPSDDHAIREERAPWGRRLVGAVLLLSVIGGAGWLASKVVVPGDVPNKPAQAEAPADNKPTPVKKSSDDEAWVKALEKDTLEGYREYLALFPEGKHKDDAQKAINAYDNKAWGIAEQRDTISGYEDYLESWPEGLHASKARERIAEKKAAAEAIAKDAAERARRDSADWDAAAQTNTIDSYGRYLTKQPRGKWVSEAQNRIDRIKADQANAAASAADLQAWEQAKAANRADSYQQYLTSFPQGAYVPQAIAAIEQLKPAPGREFTDCDTCPTMVSLPTGNANLGAADGETDARPNEKPQRPVNFTDLFAISVHEVTFSQWEACASGGGCDGRPSNNGWGGGSRPVINVTWGDAQAYAAWLSQKTGFSYSLPSEAQWEYAARGGETGSLQGGSAAALCAFANGAGVESGLRWANEDCTDPASDRTLPVGTLGANGFGVKDMIGNVAEWTLDCNTLNLRDAPTDGRADQRGSCNQRSVRGGSWFSGPADLRFATRLMQRRGDSNDFTGFRVVRKIEN